MNNFKFGIFNYVTQWEKDLSDEAGAHHFMVSFSIPELECDQEHSEIMSTKYGIGSEITDNEETENGFSILKIDFPTKQDIIDYLESKGGIYDLKFFN